MDPIAEKFPWVSTYNYAENSPIANIDLWGLQAYPVSEIKNRIAGTFNAIFGTNIRTEGRVKTPPRREITTQEIGRGAQKVGDVITWFGLGITTFTGPVGAKVAFGGSVVSGVGILIEVGSDIRDEGKVSTEDVVDLGVEVTFELAPEPIEKVLDKSGIDKQAKDIVQSRANMVIEAAEKATEQVIEQNRCESTCDNDN